MKKIILSLIVTLITTLAVVSCKEKDNSAEIGIGSIPLVGQGFVKQYFSDLKVSRVEKETDGSHDVHFTNGVEIDFDANGNWIEIDAPDGQALANTGFIPQKIREYLAQTYPNYPVNSIKKNATGYQVALVNFAGEVTFDLNGNYIGIRD